MVSLLSALSRLPWGLPWALSSSLSPISRRDNRATLDFLIEVFRRYFPSFPTERHADWARRHLQMLQWETLDALNFSRLGARGGVSIDVTGWENVRELIEQNLGFILVTNHWDRFLAAPIALARRGCRVNTLTMPVLENPSLSPAQKSFLLRKVSAYTAVTGGTWLTTGENLRPLYRSLASGGIWLILTDAWSDTFQATRPHDFLGQKIELPIGVERIAEFAGAPMVFASTTSVASHRLEVRFRGLPTEPRKAVDTSIQWLGEAVESTPWRWWHWGLVDRMAHPMATESTT